MNSATPNHVAASKRIWGKLVVLGVALLAGGAASAAVWLSWPDGKWVARSKLQLSGRSDDVAGYDRYRQSQAALIKSRVILEAALKNAAAKSPDIFTEESDPLARMEREIRIDFSDGPEILRVSLEGDERKMVETVVNAITQVYLEEFVKKEHNERQERLRRLAGTSSNLEQKVYAKRQQLEDLSRIMTLVERTKEKIRTKSLDSAIQELVQLRSKLRNLQVRILVEMDERDLRARLAGLLYGLPNLGAAMNLALPTLLQRARWGSQDHLRQLQNDQAFSRHLETLLEADIMRLSYEKSASPALALEEFRSDIARWQEMKRRVSQQIDTLEMENQSAPRATLFEQAVVSQSERGNRQIWLTSLAGAGTLVLVLLVFAWWRH